MVVKGKNIITSLKIGEIYYPIFCAKTGELAWEQEELEVTSINSGPDREFIPGMGAGTFTATGITELDNTGGRVSITYLMQQSVRRQIQQMRTTLTDDAGGVLEISYFAFPTSLNLSRQTGSYSNSSATFRITQSMVYSDTITPPPTPSDYDYFEDTWEAVEGENTITGAGVEGKDFAGGIVLLVHREGTQHDPTNGTPGNRQYNYDNVDTITFAAGNPFNAGERVHVVWKILA